MSHMLKHHVGIPLGVFLLLLAVGVPFATALFVGLMSGCMAMMFMMMGHGSGQADGDKDPEARRKHR